MPTKKKVEGKLIDILKTFDKSKKDDKRFEAYLETPLTEKVSKNAIVLYHLIQKNYPTYDNLFQETLFQKIYGKNKPYKAGTFKNLISELYQAAKGFITFLEYEQHSNLRQDFLFEGLLKHRLPNIFSFEHKKAQTNANKTAHKDITQLYEQFLLSHRANQYTTMYNSRNTNTTLQTAIQDLDSYYIAAKLKYFVVALTWQRIIKTEHELYFFDEILNMVEQREIFKAIPIIQLYYQLTLALKHFHTEPIYFKNAQQLLIKYGTQFPKNEARQLYTIALNYCRWKINEGDLSYAKEAVTLYKVILDHEILYAAGYIKSDHFRNIVKVGIESKDLVWTKNIIEQYGNKITPEHQENITHYSLAALAFAEKDYAKAKQHLADVFIQNEFVDFYYHIYYKTLLIKTLYELKEMENVLKELEAFRQYFSRNSKAPKGVVATYQNFIKIVRKLVNRKGKNFVGFVKKNVPVVEKSWLLEKAEILEAKRNW